MLTDCRCDWALTSGEAHDNRLCSVLLRGLKPETMLLADRAYDADWTRAFINGQGAWANIPPKRNRKDPICFSPYLYRARNLVERFFNKIKHCRRIATCHDKLAANYLAFVELASIRFGYAFMSSRPKLARPPISIATEGRPDANQLDERSFSPRKKPALTLRRSAGRTA